MGHLDGFGVGDFSGGNHFGESAGECLARVNRPEADLLGRPVGECLSLATAYASLSLAQPAPRQKGLTAVAFRVALAATEAPMDWLQEV